VFVLVTDGEDRAALATTRALARAGHSVVVAAGRRPAPAQWSSACTRRLLFPRSLDAERFVRASTEELASGDYNTLTPTTDAALLALSSFRECLPRALRSSLPPHDVVTRSLNKPALLDASAQAGFAVPESEECADRGAVFAAAASLGFPLVVKPTMSIVVVDGRARREAARVVRNGVQLDNALSALGTPVLVQRFYERAHVLSLAGVASEHGLAAVVAARWRRRWPTVDGAASFAETVVPPSSAVRGAETLVGALGWRGIFELELLALGRGQFAPIDLNPRPFGWMTLALRAGANLPALWLDCLRGLDPPVVVARSGVRYRWEEGDFRHLVWQVRRGRPRAAATVLRPHRSVAHAYFELDDPSPFAAAVVGLAGRGLARTFTRRE
jgi:predicted ATP-grasp superfamily ATP-dependent carboligase